MFIRYAAIAGSAAGLAGVTAVRASRRATRAAAALADEADRLRARDAERQRLTAAAGELGERVRQRRSIADALAVAAAGLGRLLRADHVVVRLVGASRAGVRWSAAASAGNGLVTGPGPTEPLAGLDPRWLLRGDGERARSWTDLYAGGPGVTPGGVAPGGVAPLGEPMPPEERAALLAAGATAALSVPFRVEPGSAGAVTLVRCATGACWSPSEADTVRTVSADLGRALLWAELEERERELADRLRDLENVRTDFMVTVSHELRTPLTSIAGYLHILAEHDGGTLTDVQRQMIAAIERGTARLNALIDDLLVLTRIETGALRAELREVEYGWLVTAAVAGVRPAADAAGVRVDADVGAGLAGRADPEQIDLVLTNLLGNAVKFTPDGGRVRVRADREGEYVVIEVSDTGIGIPGADQEKVFQRFVRAGNAAGRAIQGTGLGLAIVRAVVEQHGGRASLTSREGGGTTVTVRLPR